MAALVMVSDRFVPDIGGFKARHRGCEQPLAATGRTLDGNFTYVHAPDSHGGVTEVRCACGDRLVICDGEATEIPAAKGMDVVSDLVPSALAQCVSELHRAMASPESVVGSSGPGALRDVESMWTGMEVALFHVPGCEAFDRIIMEWTGILYEALADADGAGESLRSAHDGMGTRRFRYSDAYLASGMGWHAALAAWDLSFCSYMWDNWPAIAGASRVPRPLAAEPCADAGQDGGGTDGGE